MEKEARNLFFRATPWIFFLVLPLLYVHILWVNHFRFDQWIQFSSSSETIVISSTKVLITETFEEKQDSQNSIFSTLVKGEDRKKLEATGFACDKGVYSIHCVANHPVQIDTSTMTVTVASNQAVLETIVRPYARQEDATLLKTVRPVKILHGNATPPVCQYNHKFPAVIFSSGGFAWNVFHEINEILIPLFITTRSFKSRVTFIMEDYRLPFVTKYGKALSRLTKHEIINPVTNKGVHCFPGAVVGLKFHGHLSLNPTDIPKGLTMHDFRQFLRQSFNLKYNQVSQIEKPTLVLLSRTTTRRFLNEDEIVSMLEELGFEVNVVARAKTISDISTFAKLINSCTVFVGAHGAGLTNELFLPDGAVMVQVDLIGLEWAAATYYGDTARAMGVRYLRYKIEPRESSLVKVFGRTDHVAIRDPTALPVEAGKEVYLNGQNVRIDVARFRETMVEAMSLVRD